MKISGGLERDESLPRLPRTRAHSTKLVLLSFGKVDATIVLANEILARGEAIVIFVTYVETGKAIQIKLSDQGSTAEFLSAETVKTTEKRHEMVKRFQDTAETNVLISTYGVGGVGITLTRARSIILVDRPWTPGDVAQAEDRVRRLGQTREVHSYWLQATTMDMEIDKLVEAKDRRSKTMQGQASGDGGGGANSISIREILACKNIFHQPLVPKFTVATTSDRKEKK